MYNKILDFNNIYLGIQKEAVGETFNKISYLEKGREHFY